MMATGYVYALEKHPMNFRQFAQRVARGLTPCVMLRDEEDTDELPDVVSDLAKRDQAIIDDAELKLRRFRLANHEEMRAQYDAEVVTLQKHREEVQADALMWKERIEPILAEARVWQPPTPDHEYLKSWIISQLEDGLRSSQVTVRYFDPAPYEEWLKSREENLTSTLTYLRNQLIEHAALDAKRNAWVKALKESLP